MYDVLIVGGGPAGFTDALYAARAGRTVLVLERDTLGGQIAYAPREENYPGMPEMSGAAFAEQLQAQAEAVRVEVDFTAVTGLSPMEGDYAVETEDETYLVRAIVLALGASHRHLGLPREEDLIGAGGTTAPSATGPWWASPQWSLLKQPYAAAQDKCMFQLCFLAPVMQFTMTPYNSRGRRLPCKQPAASVFNRFRAHVSGSEYTVPAAANVYPAMRPISLYTYYSAPAKSGHRVLHGTETLLPDQLFCLSANLLFLFRGNRYRLNRRCRCRLVQEQPFLRQHMKDHRFNGGVVQRGCSCCREHRCLRAVDVVGDSIGNKLGFPSRPLPVNGLSHLSLNGILQVEADGKASRFLFPRHGTHAPRAVD